MSTESFAFTVMTTTLLGTPLVAGIASWGIPRLLPSSHHLMYRGLGGVLACVVSADIFGFSLWRYEANALALCVAYICFAVLAVSAFRLRPRLVGLSLGILLSLPLAAGALLGSIGVLIVAFILGDSVPLFVGTQTDGSKCYVTSFGNATTATGGYDVVVKHSLPVFSFLQVSTAQTRFVDPAFTPAGACSQFSSVKGS